MTSESSQNHPFFSKWEKALNDAGFNWSKNEYAFLLKATMNKPSYKSIMTFFGELRRQPLQESSNLNVSLFIMFSKELDFFGEELEKEFTPLIQTLFKKDSPSLRFFQKHFCVLKKPAESSNLDLYYKLINEGIEFLKDQEWVIQIPPWLFGFLFFFDESEKAKLSHSDLAILHTFEEINRIDFCAFPNPLTGSVLCSSFTDLDLAMTGIDFAEFATKTVIYYQKQRDDMKTDPHFLASHIFQKKHEIANTIFNESTTFGDIYQKCKLYFEKVRSKQPLEELNDDEKIIDDIFKNMIDEYEKQWDFTFVPISFATNHYRSLLLHDEKSVDEDMQISSQKLYQSLLRATRISTGYQPNQEELQNGYFSDTEYFLGSDIKKATDYAKSQFIPDNQPEKKLKYFHIMQHMAMVLSEHDKVSFDDFTKLIYGVDQAAALTFLFALYARITNIYEWWLLWKAFTRTKEQIKIYMDNLKSEHDALRKDEIMIEKIELIESDDNPVAASSSDTS